MSLSAARQKELSQQLASLAGITQRQATNVLKKYDFKIDRAADAIYNGSVVLDSKSSAKQASLEKIFNKYKGNIDIDMDIWKTTACLLIRKQRWNRNRRNHQVYTGPRAGTGR